MGEGGDIWVPRVPTYIISVCVFVYWVQREQVCPEFVCVSSDIWVPRVPSILLLCGCFFYGYHGYQVCLVLGYGVAIYGYHGYQLYFFCLGDFVMGTTVPSMFCIGVWGSDLLVPRVPGILLLSGSICNGYHGSKNVMNLLGCGAVINGYHGYQV